MGGPKLLGGELLEVNTLLGGGAQGQQLLDVGDLGLQTFGYRGLGLSIFWVWRFGNKSFLGCEGLGDNRFRVPGVAHKSFGLGWLLGPKLSDVLGFRDSKFGRVWGQKHFSVWGFEACGCRSSCLFCPGMRECLNAFQVSAIW